MRSVFLSLNYLCIYIKIDLTSETTSWDMSLCMAARHIWVIFGSFVPQPIRKGWTTSELFSFNAFKKRYGSSQCLILWRIQCKILLITLLQSWKFEIYSCITGRSQLKTVDCHSSLPQLPGWHSNPKHLLTHLHPYTLRWLFSFQIQNVHVESICLVRSGKVLPTPEFSGLVAESSLRLVAFSFCSASPQHQIQKQHEV